MNSKEITVDAYVQSVSEDKKQAIQNIRSLILNNLPKGYEEIMLYAMISFVVPHSLYPKGYHCTPTNPLPFISLAAQKNSISFYHMGIYADKKLLKWFQDEYKKLEEKKEVNKLDMGKSCIRFKNINKIPYRLLEELCKKVSVKEWVELYESNLV